MRDRLYRLSNARRYAAVQSDARAVIAEALARADGGTVAVGVSGGKDSVAMLHLVLQHCDRPHVIFNDSGLETPEARPIVEGLCVRYGLPLLIAAGDAVSLEVQQRDTDAAIFGPVRAALRSIGAALEFVGLRSAESKWRRITIAKYGPIHDSKRFGCLIAWPMRQWSGADVFAYIDEHGLPLHPAYSRVPDADRDATRVSWVYDSGRDYLQSDVAMLRRHYPAIFRRLRDLGVIT